MKTDIIAVYDDLLSSGIIDSSFHGETIRWIESRPSFIAEEAVRFALLQSVSDVIRVSGSHGFDEEHLTASLAGTLTANLTWFAKNYRRSGGKEILPALRWIHQTKHSEARSGIDLGILARIPGGRPERAYRLVFLQAKLGNSTDLTIDVSHETNSRKGDRKPRLAGEALSVFEAAASFKAASGPDLALLERAAAIARKAFGQKQQRYQLEAILRTDLRGRELAGSDREWCFYAGWFSQRLPRIVGIRSLAVNALSAPNQKRPSIASLPSQGAYFVNLVLDTMYRVNTPYGLELSESQVGSAVDGLFETAPDMRLLLASTDGELKHVLKQTNGRFISGSLIPERWLAPAPRRRPSPEYDGQRQADSPTEETETIESQPKRPSSPRPGGRG